MLNGGSTVYSLLPATFYFGVLTKLGQFSVYTTINYSGGLPLRVTQFFQHVCRKVMDLHYESFLSLEAPAPQTHNMQQAADNVAHTSTPE